MSGYLTTHVLDTARGRPARGIAISLYRLEAAGSRLLNTAMTNADGRTDAPILPAVSFAVGQYELVFHAGEYLDAQDAGPRFLDDIPIRFRVSDAAVHYHVPLLLSPYGYSTYRGS